MRCILTWSCLLLVVVLLMVPAPAYAQEEGDGQAIFGRDFVVGSGDVIPGDLLVMGGDVIVEDGGYVRGDLAVVGGDADLAGEIRGDVVALGGDVHLAATAQVHGDLAILGGRLTEEEGAIVRGQKMEGLRFGRLWPVRIEGPVEISPGLTLAAERSFVLDFIFGLFRAVFIAVGLAVLAVLVVLSIPEHTRRVGRAMVEAPVISLAVGFLTLAVSALLVPLLVLISTALLIVCIGLFGYVVTAFVVLALAAAWVFGWIALGWMVGERLLNALGVGMPEPWIAAGLGVLLLSLLGAMPCVGLVFSVVAGSIGLGAVILTRLGTQRYPMPFAGPPPAAPEGPPSPASGGQPPVSRGPEGRPAPPAAAREPGAEPAPAVASLAEEPEPPLVVEEGAGEERTDDLKVIHGLGPVFEERLH